MKKIIFLIVLVVALVLILKMQKNNDKVGVESTGVAPSVDVISHASMILNWNGTAIYTDPVGEEKMFLGKPDADLILITDIHGDHLDIPTLKRVVKDNTMIVAPKAVADMIPSELKSKVSIMNNGEMAEKIGFSIEAIPMYNLPESPTAFHTKGRGNGYVIEKDGERVYISGDTSGTPEMKNLKNIDIAFICMNLPYTMSVAEAADAVLAFKPKQVYPYHYKGQDGLSDVTKFKELVNSKDSNIEVVQLNWYPN